MDDLQPMLEDVLATFPLSFIVLDAIDECDQVERDTLLSILKKVVESSRTKLKIFIASRPSLDQEISKTFKVYHHQSMNSPGLHSDIADYIQAIIQEKRIDGELKVGNETLINEIQDILVKGAQGMLVKSLLKRYSKLLNLSGSSGLLFRCAISALKSATRIFAKSSKICQKTYRKLTIVSLAR